MPPTAESFIRGSILQLAQPASLSKQLVQFVITVDAPSKLFVILITLDGDGS